MARNSLQKKAVRTPARRRILDSPNNSTSEAVNRTPGSRQNRSRSRARDNHVLDRQRSRSPLRLDRDNGNERRSRGTIDKASHKATPRRRAIGQSSHQMDNMFNDNFGSVDSGDFDSDGIRDDDSNEDEALDFGWTPGKKQGTETVKFKVTKGQAKVAEEVLQQVLTEGMYDKSCLFNYMGH